MLKNISTIYLDLLLYDFKNKYDKIPIYIKKEKNNYIMRINYTHEILFDQIEILKKIINHINDLNKPLFKKSKKISNIRIPDDWTNYHLYLDDDI